jgi:hypothetical protein
LPEAVHNENPDRSFPLLALSKKVLAQQDSSITLNDFICILDDMKPKPCIIITTAGRSAGRRL